MTQTVRDETGLVCYSGVTELMVSNFIRVACATGLQCLSKLISAATGFLVALDCATLHRISYLDVRCRFGLRGKLHNFHMMAVPLFERHTAGYPFEILERFLDAMLPTRRGLVVGVSTDGENTMTGHIKGLATRITEEAAGQKVIRVWCGLHQLDLAMKRCFEATLDEMFVSDLMGLIGYLRCQKNWSKINRSECPFLVATRWKSMYTCANWLTKNVIVVEELLESKQPLCRLSIKWWIFLFSVRAFTLESDKVITALQGRTTLLSEQHAALKELIETYKCMTNMKGPVSESAIGKLERGQHEVCGEYILRYSDAFLFIKRLDIWVLDKLVLLDPSIQQELTVAVAKLFVEGVNGIDKVTAERDSVNSPYDERTLVLPHQLLSVDIPAFAVLLAKHRPRLELSLNSTAIHQISQELVAMQRCCEREDDISSVIRACTDGMSFEDAWSVVGSQFPALLRFCRDLATTFPNTASVESDFSKMGWEKDIYRRSLSNFSLEGILQTKQFEVLKGLADSIGDAND